MKPTAKLEMSQYGDSLLKLLSGKNLTISPVLLEDERWTEGFAQACIQHSVNYVAADLLRNSGAGTSRALRHLLRSLEHDKSQRAAYQLGADAQLGEIAETFSRRKIPLMLLKGIVLVHTLYRANPLFRSFSDLDILIPEPYFEAAVDAFSRLGYALAPHKGDLEALRKYNHKLSYLPPGGRPCCLDVHFRLVGKKTYERGSAFSTDQYWRRPDTCEINGRAFLIPNRELMLLHLLIHLSLQHCLSSLRWLYDVKLFLESYRAFDWEYFTEKVNDFRAGRAAWFSLQAAKEILDAPVPPRVLEELRPAVLGLVERYWLGTMMAKENIAARAYHHRKTSPLGTVARMFSEVILIDRRKERYRAVGRALFPDPKFFRAAYRVSGPGQLLFSYLVHPLVVIAVPAAVALITVKYIRENNRL